MVVGWASRCPGPVPGRCPHLTWPGRARWTVLLVAPPLPPPQTELAVHSTFGLHQDAHSFLEPRTMTRYFGERFTFQSNISYVVFMSVIISLRSSSQSQSMVILLGKHLYLHTNVYLAKLYRKQIFLNKP